MNLENYNRIVDKFAVANCKIKEDDIMSNLKPKRRFRILTAVAASVIFIFAGTTVCAATGIIDLENLFKKLFTDDQVTSELIEEGAVQEVNISTQKDNYTITFEGITGDSNTQFGVFKLVDAAGELGDPSLLQVDVKMVGMSVVEEGRLSQYSYCYNDSFEVSENEENTYYIKVWLPSHWIYYSEEDIYMELDKVTAYYGNLEFFKDTTTVVNADRKVEIPFSYVTTFTPDRSVLPKSTEFVLDTTIMTEYGEFTFKSYDVSRYESDLVIIWPTNENIRHRGDANVLWHQFDNDYIYEYLGKEFDPVTIKNGYGVYSPYVDGKPSGDYYLSVNNPEDYLDGDVKIFVDGVQLKRKPNNAHRQVSSMDDTEHPEFWGNRIIFETFDASAAQSIEIRWRDQVIKVK